MARTEEEKLKKMQELTMLQKEEEAIAGKFNAGLEKYASLDSDELLSILKEVVEED